MPPEGVRDHINRNQEPNPTAKAGQGFAAPIAPRNAKVLTILARIILMASFILRTVDRINIYNYSDISI